ncbi:protein chiffon-like isoform X2 [Periplaneta americana]|uniref:protein chiffon-like isoform X2 n=1 Tax=Periplaneta americana TaxID=6978 RepID=UPI0037E7B10A
MLSSSKKERQKEKEGRSQHRKSTKPLQNKKFYLDLKNHVAANNLEQRLKSLGAIVELFLVKEVNYVVTDRSHWTGASTAASGGSVSGSTPKCGAILSPSLTPLGGQCSNESPATLDSPGDGLKGGGRRRSTRAEAMLERARLQPQQCTVDPLDNAARWNIPIWPLEKVLKWIDKICNKYFNHSSTCSEQKKQSTTGLKIPYIKLESVNRQYRPVYKELSVWPSISLDFEPGGCPFTAPKVSEKKVQEKKGQETPGHTPKPTRKGNEAASAQKSTKQTVETPRMTRKARSRLHRGNDTTVALQNSAIVSGYCEICQLTFVDQKKHLLSDRHSKFIANSNNFLSLDHLINQGPTMDAFLKLNGANQISTCPTELSGSTRRSLRSVVKLHSLTLDASTSITSPAAWKGNEPLSSTPKRPAPVSNTNGHHVTRSSGLKQHFEEKSKMLLQQKESLEVQCNGIWSHCYDTRHGGMKSPLSGNIRRVQWEIQGGGEGGGSSRPQRVRRASASFCSSTSPSLQQQLSPTGSDSGHHLRSRGQIWLPSNLLGTTAEDEGYPVRTRLGHSSAEPQPARTCRDIPLTRSDDEKPKAGLVIKEEVKSPCRSGNIKEEVKSAMCRSGNSQVIRRKRLSVEEKLIEDNKAYYKLELKNSKLRSSGYFPAQREIEMPLKSEVKEEKVESSIPPKVNNSVKCNGEQGHEGTKKESKVEETVTVKFQRVRKSELTLLSDEAESFMFGEPVRKDSSSDSSEEEEEEKTKTKVNKSTKKDNCNEDTNVKKLVDNKKHVKKKDGENNSRNNCNVPPVVHLKIDGENGNQCNMLQCDESSVGSIDTCSLASSCDTSNATRQKRKRRTHAEAFIHDNLDYYKFEIPGSRLRFQGSILPPTLTSVENKVNSVSNKDSSGSKQGAGTPSSSKSDSTSKGGKATCNGAHTKVVTCSNEISNEKEHIVHTQEESKEKVVGESESKSAKKQEKEDDRKKEEQDDSNLKESVENELLSSMEKLHFSFEVVPQSEPWYQTYTRQDEGEEFYAYSFMSDSCYWKPFLLPYEMPAPEGLASGCGGPGGGSGSSGLMRKRRNRFAHLLDKKPRKSPRCHASTLAILSSLMHHRRRKEPDKFRDDTTGNNSAEEDNASRDATSEIKDEPNTSPNTSMMVPTSPESTPVVQGSNSDFKSESDADLHEIARNIDRMFGLGSEGEEGSGSENDMSSDELKQEVNTTPKLIDKNRKSSAKKNVQSRKNSNAKAKKLELKLGRHQEIMDVDPVVLEELSGEHSISSTREQIQNRCRGGPKMDVVTLLDEFSTCRCVDEPVFMNKDCLSYLNNPSLHLGESSCNSSECGASSTCETITFSDGFEGRVLQIRGRKRKRKKNLTGWPAEKQRGKKKTNKVNRIEEHGPSADDGTAKCVNVSDKLTLSTEERIASGVKRDNCGSAEKVIDEATVCRDKLSEKSDRVGTCRDDSNNEVGKSVNNSASGGSEPSIVQEKRASALARTESVDSTGGHSSSEYQPCVRMTKIPDIAGVVVTSLPNSSSSSYFVAGISNNRRLRSSSLSSSSPGISVPVQKRSPSVSSSDGLKRPVGSSPSKRRASPRKCHPRSGIQWSTWSARKRR